MRLSDLQNKHEGKEIWIVGTGPSMLVFPTSLLKDKITIGLNQAWKYLPTNYMITVHPELYQDYVTANPDPASRPSQWIIKKKAPMAYLEFDDPEVYVFTTDSDYKVITSSTENTLFQANGIQATAIHAAYLMGASAIFLVGCDCCVLNGNHHGHDQHVRYLGLSPVEVFTGYRKSTAVARRTVNSVREVPVVTVSPFIGLDHAEEDMTRLMMEKQLTRLPTPPDVSPYLINKTVRKVRIKSAKNKKIKVINKTIIDRKKVLSTTRLSRRSKKKGNNS